MRAVGTGFTDIDFERGIAIGGFGFAATGGGCSLLELFATSVGVVGEVGEEGSLS